MSTNREYQDIPGTYVFDGEHHRKGYHLNMFAKSLDVAANRDAFRAAPEAYLDALPLSAQQRRAVLERDWLGMLRLGGNIYYIFKLAIFDGLSMQHVGAAMSDPAMSVEQFRQMMLDGGRPIAGNRSRKEQHNG
jgi:protocatechuate 4,5-dioxygenase, alpha chain